MVIGLEVIFTASNVYAATDASTNETMEVDSSGNASETFESNEVVDDVSDAAIDDSSRDTSGTTISDTEDTTDTASKTSNEETNDSITSEEPEDLHDLSADELYEYLLSIDADKLDKIYDKYDDLDSILKCLSDEQTEAIQEKFGNSDVSQS